MGAVVAVGLGGAFTLLHEDVATATAAEGDCIERIANGELVTTCGGAAEAGGLNLPTAGAVTSAQQAGATTRALTEGDGPTTVTGGDADPRVLTGGAGQQTVAGNGIADRLQNPAAIQAADGPLRGEVEAGAQTAALGADAVVNPTAGEAEAEQVGPTRRQVLHLRERAQFYRRMPVEGVELLDSNLTVWIHRDGGTSFEVRMEPIANPDAAPEWLAKPPSADDFPAEGGWVWAMGVERRPFFIPHEVFVDIFDEEAGFGPEHAIDQGERPGFWTTPRGDATDFDAPREPSAPPKAIPAEYEWVGELPAIEDVYIESNGGGVNPYLLLRRNVSVPILGEQAVDIYLEIVTSAERWPTWASTPPPAEFPPGGVMIGGVTRKPGFAPWAVVGPMANAQMDSILAEHLSRIAGDAGTTEDGDDD